MTSVIVAPVPIPLEASYVNFTVCHGSRSVTKSTLVASASCTELWEIIGIFTAALGVGFSVRFDRGSRGVHFAYLRRATRAHAFTVLGSLIGFSRWCFTVSHEGNKSHIKN